MTTASITITPIELEHIQAQAADAERARIATWLRAQAKILADMIHSTSPEHYRHLADLIEGGVP